MLERDYQAKLILRIKSLIIGCQVLKNDAEYIQGFPDLIVVKGIKCGFLEVKREKNSLVRPNQIHYVKKLNASGGFARFIFPENEMEVLRELQQALRP